MITTLQNPVEDFMNYVRQRDGHEPEFLQAVHEVAETIIPFIQSNKKYQGHEILKRLVEAERVISFRINWIDDSGAIQVNRGYRIQMNSAIGPYKGGIRFHPSVNQSILKFLAFEQTFKNALTTLPMGGGKGGSDFNPKGKSDVEIMRFCQAFMAELSRHIGANTDVPAGDIGVGAREIGYMYGMYKKLRNENTGVFTGKGISYGGSLIRPEATGYGAVFFAQHMLETRGDSMSGKTVIISGSGNVAQFACEKATALGAKVVAMSDSSGCIYDVDGIDADKLEYIMTLKNVHRGRIKEYASVFSSSVYIEGGQPWDIPCDVAFPCATQNEINETEAQTLVDKGCICVCEGANMPCTPEAVTLFLKHKILFGPGKAANAGGVATSGLEMSQNALRLNWTREEVEDRLKRIMSDIHTSCTTYGMQEDGYINYVQGANIAGFVKVADAMIAQGLV